ncbi:glycosyltransferase [Vibrio sp. JPW-9-11-11]|uniref:glycosyltransferase family protein n=1 Tax=Vibrio sp. JPW-9-11-11 TaxID=1416532 RepID=UPI001592D7A3|nr:glycosyltransferase [Vibrio sp. JPW-9-11-11]
MIKLLFYSHDSYGLGNIRRMIAIAEYLIEQHSNVTVLLITGSTMLHAFRTNHALDYVKLPCLGRDQLGQYRPKLDSFSHCRELIALRGQMIQQVLQHYQPDLFLVDKKPIGLGNELSRSFQYLQSCSKRPRLVLLLRDILDSAKVTSRIWRKNHYFTFIDKHYDQVLIAGQQSVFDATRHYQFPNNIREKTSYLGYLQRPIPTQDVDKTERPDTNIKRVLVTVGGGNDGVSVITHYLQGLAQSEYRSNIHSTVICGPEMSARDIENLFQLAAPLSNVTMLQFSDELTSYIANSDLIVSMGGYNTVCEILSAGKPALIIPRTTPCTEQLIRAQSMSRLKLFDYIHPEQVSGKALMEKVADMLNRLGNSTYHQKIRLDGMENISQWILSLASSRRLTH